MNFSPAPCYLLGRGEIHHEKLKTMNKQIEAVLIEKITGRLIAEGVTLKTLNRANALKATELCVGAQIIHKTINRHGNIAIIRASMAKMLKTGNR